MSGKSAIEWTDATWNPVTGCSKVSPGCAHCYAETISLRFGHSKLPWTPENAAENVVLHPERLDAPLKWRKPRMVFVNSMSDLFHELVPFEFISAVYAIMHACRPVRDEGRPHSHTFQVLTKRPERAAEFYASEIGKRATATLFGDPLPNVWLGVSIENARYTYRADVLREIPAAVRFISAEPLLGSLLSDARKPEPTGAVSRAGLGGGEAQAPGDANRPPRRYLDLSGIDWLIVGGESGAHARPMDPEWARELRDSCLYECFVDPTQADARGIEDGYHPDRGPHRRTAFFFKQWGGRTPKSGGRLLDGREWNEMPTVAS